MFSQVEMALLTIIEELTEELNQKRAEVKQGLSAVLQAQRAVQIAEQRARHVAQQLRTTERELEIVVGLYNRDRLEWLSHRFAQLRSGAAALSQSREEAKQTLRERQLDLHDALIKLEDAEGEQQQMQAYRKKLYALLRQKRDVWCGLLPLPGQGEQGARP